MDGFETNAQQRDFVFVDHTFHRFFRLKSAVQP